MYLYIIWRCSKLSYWNMPSNIFSHSQWQSVTLVITLRQASSSLSLWTFSLFRLLSHRYTDLLQNCMDVPRRTSTKFVKIAVLALFVMDYGLFCEIFGQFLEDLFLLNQWPEIIHISWLTSNFFNLKQVSCYKLECDDHSATWHFNNFFIIILAVILDYVCYSTIWI